MPDEPALTASAVSAKTGATAGPTTTPGRRKAVPILGRTGATGKLAAACSSGVGGSGPTEHKADDDEVVDCGGGGTAAGAAAPRGRGARKGFIVQLESSTSTLTREIKPRTLFDE